MSSGSTPLPCDLLNITALGIPHQPMNENGIKGLLPHLFQPEKIIRATQKKMMS
jgi:hypothetical protein